MSYDTPRELAEVVEDRWPGLSRMLSRKLRDKQNTVYPGVKAGTPEFVKLVYRLRELLMKVAPAQTPRADGFYDYPAIPESWDFLLQAPGYPMLPMGVFPSVNDPKRRGWENADDLADEIACWQLVWGETFLPAPLRFREDSNTGFPHLSIELEQKHALVDQWNAYGEVMVGLHMSDDWGELAWRYDLFPHFLIGYRQQATDPVAIDKAGHITTKDRLIFSSSFNKWMTANKVIDGLPTVARLRTRNVAWYATVHNIPQMVSNGSIQQSMKINLPRALDIRGADSIQFALDDAVACTFADVERLDINHDLMQTADLVNSTKWATDAFKKYVLDALQYIPINPPDMPDVGDWTFPVHPNVFFKMERGYKHPWRVRGAPLSGNTSGNGNNSNLNYARMVALVQRILKRACGFTFDQAVRLMSKEAVGEINAVLIAGDNIAFFYRVDGWMRKAIEKYMREDMDPYFRLDVQKVNKMTGLVPMINKDGSRKFVPNVATFVRNLFVGEYDLGSRHAADVDLAAVGRDRFYADAPAYGQVLSAVQSVTSSHTRTPYSLLIDRGLAALRAVGLGNITAADARAAADPDRARWDPAVSEATATMVLGLRSIQPENLPFIRNAGFFR